MKEQPKRLTILTGAGMSTESGVPDFRSQTGLWTNHDPMQTATVQALEHNYEQFHAFYRQRLESLQTITPHNGHRIITEWQKKGFVTLIATQNVDRLHQESGSENVAELHGNLREFKCHDCQTFAHEEDFLSQKGCRWCGGKLRPNIVLFGEQLPIKAWEYAAQCISESDALLVIGTSLEVSPVNQLPELSSGERLYINDEINTPIPFTRTMKMRAGEGLERLSREWGK